uniref:Uncharacterized protein n=1 Tax=Megaselia scalaris TaxID=36166 RepID=T1GRY4_MEGSC
MEVGQKYLEFQSRVFPVTGPATTTSGTRILEVPTTMFEEMSLSDEDGLPDEIYCLVISQGGEFIRLRIKLLTSSLSMYKGCPESSASKRSQENIILPPGKRIPYSDKARLRRGCKSPDLKMNVL